MTRTLAFLTTSAALLATSVLVVPAAAQELWWNLGDAG